MSKKTHVQRSMLQRVAADIDTETGYALLVMVGEGQEIGFEDADLGNVVAALREAQAAIRAARVKVAKLERRK